MRRLTMSAILVGILPLVAPANAQFAPGRAPPPQTRMPNSIVVGTSHPSTNIWRDIDDVRDDIDHARESGQMTKREARSFRRDARAISSLADRYGRDGLSASEQRELETRSLYLQGLVNAQRIR